MLRSADVSIVVENSEVSDDTTGELLVGSFTRLSFTVENISESHNKLTRSEVEFLDPPEKQPWGGTIASFKDPDGNTLTLVQSWSSCARCNYQSPSEATKIRDDLAA
ncbi:hypothetical protein S7335_2664 [Synechococcus sp. PCC 7335]|nr:hypothetical protein S7335_2664 [Synechococcus sp. PCC 7335]